MKKYLLVCALIFVVVSLKAQTSPAKEDTTIYSTGIQVSPNFPGGPAEFGKFLSANVHIPDADKKSNTQGRVFLQFVVEKDGSLSHYKAIRTPSETLTAEAIRVMMLSPKWSPGFKDNNPVRVRYTLPINFAF